MTVVEGGVLPVTVGGGHFSYRPRLTTLSHLPRLPDRARATVTLLLISERCCIDCSFVDVTDDE